MPISYNEERGEPIKGPWKVPRALIPFDDLSGEGALQRPINKAKGANKGKGALYVHVR